LHIGGIPHEEDGIGRGAKLIARNVKSSLIRRRLFDRPGTRASPFNAP
jgi:hypothetical protein